MPASTLDPVNAALRTSLSKTTTTENNNNNNNLDQQLSGSSKKALLSNIDFEPAGSYQSVVLDKLKSKYIVLKSAETPQASKPESMGADETLSVAKHELYPLEAVQLGWNNSDWAVGAGMVNMGNTCYLNSTLQALFHVPALINWLISDKQHMAECEDSGGLCIICAVRKTLQDSQQRNANSIRPFLIYNKLRVVCRNLIPGRQEDAHEFLRYLVEAMEKAYLNRFKNHTEFDSRTKETTPLNQILGGYLRSAVRCLECGHVSTTFQHFQDLLLDIRKAQTLDEALEVYFSREKLDDESYHCESCQKKVPATKQFSLERAPMVLCIQLKRFSVSNNKITKHIQFRQRLELSRYARQRPSVPLVYRLVALVTHMGPTVGCGHYTAVAQAPCGNFYQFDDSMVRPISHQAVFSTNAYIMLYELENAPFAQKSSTTTNGTNCNKLKLNQSPQQDKEKINRTVQINGNTCNKPYGPELPPKLDRQNGISNNNNNNNHINGNKYQSINNDTNKTHIKFNGIVVKDENSAHLTQRTSSTNIMSNVLLHKNNNNNNNNKENGTTNANNKTTSVTTNVSSSTANPITKLVPYDDESSSSDSESSLRSPEETNSRVSTKAAIGEWKVTSTTSDMPTLDDSTTKKNEIVSELLKMSHGGYSAPVTSWNGNRAALDKEILNEKREDRKRTLGDDTEQQGRVKHVKTNSNENFKSNPGYNPIQEHHNAKNWGHNTSYRQFYNGNRHRNNNNNNNNKRKFQHKNNYHKNYRFRQ